MSVHLDPVKLVLEKLKIERKISSKSIRQTQSALRLMNLQIPLGQFGKHDQDFRRAAALLEYIVREEEGYKIPYKQLALAALLKESNFVKLHETIGKFRQTTKTNTSSSDPITKHKKNAENFDRGENKKNDRTSMQGSSIPSLALRLGNLIQDPNRSIKKAEELFQDIRQHAKNMGSDSGRQQLYDMKRYQSAYEAACLYLVASSDKSLSKNTSNNANDVGGENNAGLDVESVLDASTDFTNLEFKQVLRHVEKVFEAIGPTRKDAPAIFRNKRHISMDSRLPSKSSDKRIKSAKNNKSDVIAKALMDRIEKANELGNDITSEFEAESNLPSNEPEFLVWKETTLFEARNSAKDILHKETGEAKSEIDDARALARAAEDVLKRFCSKD